MKGILRFPFISLSGESADVALKNIVSVMNDSFGALQVFGAKLLRADVVHINDSGAANTAFLVTHALGVVPSFVSALPESDARLYATQDDKREWSKTSVKVRYTKANEQLLIKVEG